MKLSNDDVKNLQSILATADLGGITSVVIEDGKARGVSSDRAYAMVSTFNVPAFPQKVGLDKLNALKARLNLLGESVVINAVESERGEISILELSAGKSRVQYRCTSTAMIKAPSRIADEVISNVYVSKDEMKLVLDAVKVMNSKKVALCIRKNNAVSFEILDGNNDAFKTDLTSPAKSLTDDDITCVHYYPAEVFSSVMRHQMTQLDTITLGIGEAGVIKAEVNGHSIGLLPHIEDTDSED